jgi:hypothetical protein
MRRSRFLPCGIVVLVVLGLLSGCSRGPTEEELNLAKLEGQLETMQQQYLDLQKARTDIVTAEATLAEIEAVRERDRSDEQKAELEALPAQIDALNVTKDGAFEAVQGTLADFLNVALNDFPEHPATVQGLNHYSDEAILIAEETVRMSGDYKKAISQLDTASRYYESLGLPPYPALADKLTYLDDIRFITKERFDLVKKKMTMDEVKEAIGTPYYQNIQLDKKRGVETWLYRKREGGASAVHFKTKDNKVYNTNFDAIKTRVVEE